MTTRMPAGALDMKVVPHCAIANPEASVLDWLQNS